MRDGLLDFRNVAPADKPTLIEEIDCASTALHHLHDPDKINNAGLGNMVPQLHIHVVARFTTHPAWPGLIWSQGSMEPCEKAHLSDTIDALNMAFT